MDNAYNAMTTEHTYNKLVMIVFCALLRQMHIILCIVVKIIDELTCSSND